MPLPHLLRELALDLLALVWPTECLACGAPDREFCDDCVAEIHVPTPPLRVEIGIPAYARGLYAGPLRALLLAYKNGGSARGAALLGAQLREPLARAVAECTDTAPPVLVPVPSTPARFRERGYRPIELLLAHARRGQAMRGQVRRALRTTRGRRGQVGLSPRERARNARMIAVRHAARPGLGGREVVLVDDVMTTGATLLAARDACESAGSRVVAIAVLCVAESRAEQVLGAQIR